ncbi:MAG: ketopantoate reductase C-terminal domain-containing protein, partial [Dehalococcoidia bacterium]
ETDYLNGEIILLGTLHGVPTPYNRVIQNRVTRMLISGEPAGSVPVDEIMRLARSSAASH